VTIKEGDDINAFIIKSLEGDFNLWQCPSVCLSVCR